MRRMFKKTRSMRRMFKQTPEKSLWKKYAPVDLPH